MKNFFRVVRSALTYRMIIVGSVICSLLVAVCWGSNISAVYPFVEVVVRGQSMPDWIDHEIQESKENIAEFEAEMASLKASLAAAPESERAELKQKLSYLTTRHQAEKDALERSHWLQPHIHEWLPDDPFTTLALVMAFLLVITFLKDVFLVANMMLVAKLSQLATFDLRKLFFRRTLRLDVATIRDDRAAGLMSRFTNDLNAVGGGVSTLFGQAVREPLKMVACFVGAAIVCWRLLLVSLILAPVAAFVIGKLAKSIKRANRRSMEEMQQHFRLLSETFNGIQAVKAFTMERRERSRFHRSAKKFMGHNMRIAFYNALAKPATELAGVAIIAVAVLSGAYLVLNQETHLLGIRMSDRPLSLGGLMVFYAMLAGVSDPARKLTDVFNKLQRGAAAADRVYALLDREPKIVDPAEPKSPATPHRELAFEGVTFGYDPNEPVITEVNFTLGFNETLAIVGPNGCGKTTLANLVPRFFDPDQGRIRLDDVPLPEMRLADLRRRIGVVSQQSLLFDDTVLSNIAYGSPTATDEDVVAAAKKAHAHAFIMEKLEHGYDTNVGPRGERLSGGQRQRIALARAILRNPSILILDEATSQVDLESEQLIHKVLEEFTRDRTTIIITHRLSTLHLADKIMVMDGGRIADIGTHEDLSGRCELYQRLYDIQFRQSA